MNRREFIGGGVAMAALAGCGTLKTAAVGPRPKVGDIRSFLLHLGHNMWCDWYPEDMDVSTIKDGLPDRKLRCRDDFWRASVDYVASKGVNQVVIDVGEGLVFPRRPELGIEGSWSAEKLADVLDTLRRLRRRQSPQSRT